MGMADLKLKPAGGGFDAIVLGEVMLRVDPGDVPTRLARTARFWHGGGETNVAEGLAACFGLKTTVIRAGG
jgi:2-dehydro-3-deoxygluconokinase